MTVVFVCPFCVSACEIKRNYEYLLHPSYYLLMLVGEFGSIVTKKAEQEAWDKNSPHESADSQRSWTYYSG